MAILMRETKIPLTKGRVGVHKGWVQEYDNGCKVLVSWDTPIAIVDKRGRVALHEDYWNYSKSTSAHRNAFLRETLAETKRKILNGVYELVNVIDPDLVPT